MLSIVRVFSLTIPVIASMALLAWALALEAPSPVVDVAQHGATAGSDVSASSEELTSDLVLATAACTVVVRGLEPGPSVARLSVMSFMPGALLRLPAPDHPASVHIMDGELSAVIASNTGDLPMSFTVDGGASHDQVLKFGEIVQLETGAAVTIPAGVALNIHTREAPALIVYAVVQQSSPLGGPVSPFNETSEGVAMEDTVFELSPGEQRSVECRDLL